MAQVVWYVFEVCVIECLDLILKSLANEVSFLQ